MSVWVDPRFTVGVSVLGIVQLKDYLALRFTAEDPLEKLAPSFTPLKFLVFSSNPKDLHGSPQWLHPTSVGPGCRPPAWPSPS